VAVGVEIGTMSCFVTTVRVLFSQLHNVF